MLSEIDRLKKQRVTIIAYSEGVDRWPLAARCRFLLAGVSTLLDSATMDFADSVRSCLVRIQRAEARCARERQHLKQIMHRVGVVGESEVMVDLFRTVLRISSLSDVPTLVTGETGTGKQLVALAVHALDEKRRHGPFVAVNCAAISPALAESELFGHRRGAFTGALNDRPGLIRSAHGGTLFLDEVGELDTSLQTKLLRVLQENRVLGVGEDREVQVSVRVIAATNRDLESMVEQRTFRTDLFYRLSVLALHVPPLRERSEDIKPLVQHFLARYHALDPSTAVSATPEFVEALTRIDLPGNVRQLDNLVRHALVYKDDDTPLQLADLPAEIWQELSHKPENTASAPAARLTMSTPRRASEDWSALVGKLVRDNGWSLEQSLQHCEKVLLETALELASGNQSRTARLLGITPRSVYNKLRKHHLRVDRS
jgi:transcriptional regulator with PAS, ATPase and Fis domain